MSNKVVRVPDECLCKCDKYKRDLKVMVIPLPAICMYCSKYIDGGQILEIDEHPNFKRRKL